MQIKAANLEDYLAALTPERSEALHKVYNTVRDNLPAGFAEVMQYHMPSFVVPHSTYPDGYHCTPSEPLPFISVGAQKSFLALYHGGIYADENLLNWFVGEFSKHCSRKLDMGKSCIRFRNVNHIPYALIAELATKITVQEWIASYERGRQSTQKS